MTNLALKVKDLWNKEKNWDINVFKSILNNPIDVENIGKFYIPKFLGKVKGFGPI